MFVLFYNEVGAQIERYFLDHTTGNYGVHIPKGAVAYSRGYRTVGNIGS